MEEIIIPENTLHQEDAAPRLSFCDLPTAENISGLINPSPNTSSTDPLFEFLVSQPGPESHSNHNRIIFCGKVIHEPEEYQPKGDSPTNIQSDGPESPQFSARVNPNYHVQRANTTSVSTEKRQVSARGSLNCQLQRVSAAPLKISEKRQLFARGNLDYHVQRVNVTSLTSMPAKSRRRMFMFGPVKFKPEMELSAIKRRPAEEGGGKSRWGLMKSSLRGRPHLTAVLARSLSCIGGGAERCEV